MNIEQARFNMVEQQIRPWEVLDLTVLDLLYQVRREEFVPTGWKNLAFVDMELPLGLGESMLSPKLEARLLQELRLKKSDRVLEVGTGSGYMAALISRLAATVTSVEIHESLAQQAQQKLQACGCHNVTVEIGDAAQGWQPQRQWDVIVLSGSVPIMPPAFLEALAPGGCLLAVVGDAPSMTVTRWRRQGNGVCQPESLFETVIPPLHHAVQPERFEF